MQVAIESFIRKLGESLREHYWSRLIREGKASEDVLLKPFDDLVSCVVEAWAARLDRREECAYAGSKLLHSALEGTGRRFTDSLREANELYAEGIRVGQHGPRCSHGNIPQAAARRRAYRFWSHRAWEGLEVQIHRTWRV